MSPPLAAENVTVIVALAPAATVPRTQVSDADVTGPTGMPVQPGAEIIVNGVLLTILSITVTPDASDGPRLSTCSVQNAEPPAGAGEVSGLHVLVSRRSADSTTFVTTVELLSLESGSNWSAATLAVLVIAVVALDNTWTWIVNEMLAPLTMVPRLHVRNGNTPVHGTELDRKTTLAGSVSVTTTLVAVSVPLLVTVNV
jgi:hypothetical protein